MPYRIEIKASARKEMETLPSPFQNRIDLAILTLAETPRPPRCRKLETTCIESGWVTTASFIESTMAFCSLSS